MTLRRLLVSLALRNKLLHLLHTVGKIAELIFVFFCALRDFESLLFV